MKKTFLLAALMCCLVSVSAQQTKMNRESRKDLEEISQQVEMMNSQTNIYTTTLDSISGGGSKITFDYDEHLNCTRMADYDYYEDEWVLRYRCEYEYDEQNRMVAKTDHYCETFGKSNRSILDDYCDGEREVYVYNEQGLLVEIVCLSSFNETWEEDEKYEFFYDSERRLVLAKKYYYGDDEWREVERMAWEYEEGLLVATTSRQLNDNAAWYLVDSCSYSYDNQSLCVEKIEYTLYSGSSMVSRRNRYNYEYDNGNLALETIFIFKEYIDDWEPDFKKEYTYDINDNCILWEQYFYTSNGEWVSEMAYHATYGTLGAEYISGLSLVWATAGMEFPVYRKIEQLVMESYGEGFPLDFYYSENNGFEEATAQKYAVYPNPTQGMLFVEMHDIASQPNQTYRIANIMGQTLMTGRVDPEKQEIDITSLPEGMYFITIGGNTQKIIVR